MLHRKSNCLHFYYYLYLCIIYLQIHQSLFYEMVDIKDIGCKLVHYLYMWCFYTSAFTLAAMSFERWVKFNKIYYLISYNQSSCFHRIELG